MGKEYSNSVRIRYPPSEKRLIKLLKDKSRELVQALPTIQKILLFGSYARKKPHYGSDVDLLVIVSTHRPQEFEKIYQTLFDISLDYEWTPIIISEKEYRQLRAERKEFFRNIEEEKVVIWSKNGR